MAAGERNRSAAPPFSSAQPRRVCLLVRDGRGVHEGKVASLRRFKDDVREVTTGYECGVGLLSFGDIKVGDIIEVYELEAVAPKL